MAFLKILSVLVALVSISLVLIEKYLPGQEELRRVEDLPVEVADWFQRGKYYNVFGHRIFTIWNADTYQGMNASVFLFDEPFELYCESLKPYRYFYYIL